MEKMGAINRYVGEGVTGKLFKEVYTINLGAGVTPMIAGFDGETLSSQCYHLPPTAKITVTHGWYRPTERQFRVLSEPAQHHVLNGGLLVAPLAKAAGHHCPAVPIDNGECDFEKFQEWCQRYYGRRIGGRAEEPPKTMPAFGEQIKAYQEFMSHPAQQMADVLRTARKMRAKAVSDTLDRMTQEAHGRGEAPPPAGNPDCLARRSDLQSQLAGTVSWGNSLIVLIVSFRTEAGTKAGYWCSRDSQGQCCSGYAALLTQLYAAQETILGFEADSISIGTEIGQIDCNLSNWEQLAAAAQARLDSLWQLTNSLYAAMTAARAEWDRLAGTCVVPQPQDPPQEPEDEQ